MPAIAKAWKPILRQLLREARRLPDETTRVFYRKEAKRCLKLRFSSEEESRQLLAKLRAANAGYLLPLQDCLATAFGRIGHPAAARVQSLLSEARCQDVSPRSPNKPESQWPRYTERLKAWLTHSASMRTGKAPTVKHLDWPTTLPERADPKSKEAQLLGPLPGCRQRNIRWRYLYGVARRAYPPFKQIEVSKLEDLLKNATGPSTQMRRLEGQAALAMAKETKGERPKHLTSRFMGRRYQEVLNAGPVLTSTKKGDVRKWSIERPKLAKDSAAGTRPALSEDDQAWTSR